MRWSIVLVAAVVTVAGGRPVWANGGGYSQGYNFAGTVTELTKKGRIFEPSGAADARIVSEDLRVDLLTESADVEVRYRIRNEGGARTVEIGFPVEAGNFNDFGDPKVPPISPLPRYELTLDGRPVKAEFTAEPQPEATGMDRRRKDLAGWHVSRLRLLAQTEHELVIRCRVPYSQSAFYVSEHGRKTAPTFRYRLSTGAVWKGPIERGRVEVRSLRPENDAFVIRKPAGKFRRAGNGYVWEFSDLEPTLADDIEIVVRPEVERTGGGYEFVEDRYYYFVPPTTIVASSTLGPGEGQSYDAENVSHDRERSWVEGVDGDGVGESLTFTFKKPRRIERMEINPGFAKSPELWRANNRVASVEITLNGDHTFRADLPDEYLSESRFEIPVRGYPEPIREAKLTILAVHRGSRTDDTCISEVRFLTRLSKKPAVEPSR